ncbi:MAG: TIGR04283 family arsenosugar biosynthesis glycosyltransferase [Ferruginibacter sp.]
MNKVSIIIPTFNEMNCLGNLLSQLKSYPGKDSCEIIVTDAGSTDNTASIAGKEGVIFLHSPTAGRAAQMNYGAQHAHGDILFFVHADTVPPPDFYEDLSTAVNSGYDMGRYYSKYLSPNPLLKLNAFFTRFDFFACMGGDQTLFIKKSLFEKSGGFRSDMKIMEEYEFCKRVRLNAKYIILKKTVLVSARKYETNSWFTIQRANAAILRMYRKGATQEEMVCTYRQKLQYRDNAF